MVTRVVNWNIAKRHQPWRQLVEMDADVALLQEAGKSPEDVAGRVDAGPDASWDAHQWNSDWWHGRWPKLFDRWPKVVKLSDRVGVEWYRQVSPIGWVLDDEIAVSGIGTIAVARIAPAGLESIVVASMYARWVGAHPSTNSRWKVGYSDGSAHRIVSDLSAFIGNTDPSSHRILVAGDLNMIYGELDEQPQNLASRTQTVFERMDALGLEFLGPQAPDGGRQADPTPAGLPPDTRNVPTYHTTRQTPETAANQLDYVFASRGFHEQINVRALNSPDEWGSSDHCRILIEIDDN
ncbi:endonuclease/exonuclease/phosphatase family protein [Candidatus Poriferisodalis sp.]|uniref:endonuclease/exonuclease/phosphatase family protein n=1 Tax=Candidatus Poriferisodalis sp. TaxID=3101277 RepID=UPI003C6F2C2F